MTAQAHRGLDDDEPVALAALAISGVAVDVVAWDDPGVDWSTYDRAVLRSTWDYMHRLPDFLAWLSATEAVTEVQNPAVMVRWSLDKHYLAELSDAGLPVIPTVFVEPGDRPDVPPGRTVVKPSVGAGSSGVRVHPPGHDDDVLAHVGVLHAQGSAALVQPHLPSIGTDGEIPLVFFDGGYSHAVVRHVTQGPDGVDRAERSRAYDPTSDELAVATAVVDHVTARFDAPRYARVDLARDGEGRPRILEVELAEPSLFLPEGGPGAAARLARALVH